MKHGSRKRMLPKVSRTNYRQTYIYHKRPYVINHSLSSSNQQASFPNLRMSKEERRDDKISYMELSLPMRQAQSVGDTTISQLKK